jgi:hypothetical protein
MLTGSHGGFFADLHNMLPTKDAEHYLKIAENFYAPAGEDAKFIVFYPLYPLLIRILSIVLIDKVLAGIVISIVAFGLASVLLYRLCELENFSKSARSFAITLLWISPFGLFFANVFTESLFLALTLACIYFTRQRKWAIASVFGFLSALCRTQGVIIWIFVLYEYIIACCSWSDGFLQTVKKIRADILYTLIIPAGYGVYLLINKLVQGDWFAYITHQSNPPWYQTAKWVNDNLSQHLDFGIKYPGLGPILYYAQFAAFFLAVALLMYSAVKNFRTSYIIYGLAYTTVTYLAGWMLSGGRYMMTLAPLYMMCAQVKNETVKMAILFAGGVLLVILSTLYLLNYSIM